MCIRDSAGGFDEEFAIATVEKYFAPMKQFTPKSHEKIVEKQSKPEYLLHDKKTEQIHVAVGLRTVDLHSGKKYPLSVLAAILGGGMSSRLFHEVREKRGLAYYVRTHQEEYALSLIHISTSEFGYFTIDQSLTTGSSIMPQKRNLDVMEMMRARTHKIIGAEQTVASMSAGLPSGYNADFGETKALFMQSLDTVLDSLLLCQLVVTSLKPKKEALQKAMTSELFATHAAYELVKQGMPFRDAYKQVGLALDTLPKYDTQEVLQAATHIGGTGNLLLQNITKAIKKEHIWWGKKERHYTKALAKLTNSH